MGILVTGGAGYIGSHMVWALVDAGEDVIVVPTLSDEEATERFPKGFEKIKPYLRVTPQPNL